MKIKVLFTFGVLTVLAACRSEHFDHVLVNETFVQERLSHSLQPMESILFQSNLNMQFP